ncbi:MAG: YbaK/EbsC family protein [Patescibacteria group bacterium]
MNTKPHFENTVVFSQSTRTSLEAANQLGCDVAQIAKSIVFRGLKSGKPVLVIACGNHRIDEKKVAVIIGEPVEKSDADYCREKTGFVIGGVPPYGHLSKIQTLFDESLFQYDVIWAAAGTPNSVFQTTPSELMEKTLATCADVALE